MSLSEATMKIKFIGLQLLLITVATEDIPKEICSKSNEKTTKAPLENIQQFDKLPISKFPAAPVSKINRKLVIKKASEKIHRRSMRQEKTWNKTELTWKLLNDNNDGLSRDEVENTLIKAFSMWQSVSNLKFQKSSVNSSKKVDIKVLFVEGSHNNSIQLIKINEHSNTFLLKIKEGLVSNIHFNDAHNFTVNSTNGISLLHVALHEIGHSLGLGHSYHISSVMYPFQSPSHPNLKLSEDDVKLIQALYGNPRSSAL